MNHSVPSLPELAMTQLMSCPRAGKGVHSWLFRTACMLHEYFPDKAQLASVLSQAAATCGRPVPEREVRDAVRNSSPDVLANGEHERPWPEADAEMMAGLAKDGPDLAQLKELSPVRCEPAEPHAEQIIDELFPTDALLCAGKTQWSFDTRPRPKWRDKLGGLQFIVPSPMSKVWGKTKSGEPSKHSLENTGPRRFLVVEADPTKWDDLPTAEQTKFGAPENYYSAQRDVQASVLLHLAQYAPLTMVVHSGGKSLHGWFACRGRDEAHLRKFMSFAVKLGADSSSWSRCHFVRLPGGLRDNGARQSVLFFNPSTLEKQ